MRKNNTRNFALILLSLMAFPMIATTYGEPITTTDFNSNSQNYTPQSKTALVNSTQYIFYETSSGNQIVYIFKTQTNKTWSNSIYLAGNVDSTKFSAKSDGSIIHVAYEDEDDGLRYLQLTPASNEHLTISTNTTLSNPGTSIIGVDVSWNSTRYPVIIASDVAATDHVRIYYGADVAGSTFQAPITSWTFPSEEPTTPTVCNIASGITFFLVGDTGNILTGRNWYQQNMSFGNKFTVSTSVPTSRDYSITCANNAAHVYFEETNAGYYQNITSAGMQSSNIQIVDATVDGLSITSDNSSSLLFATSKSMEILLNNYTITGTPRNSGYFNVNVSYSITNLNLPEITTSNVALISFTYNGQLGYSVYGGNFITTVNFYDSDGRSVTIQNMTLVRLSDLANIEFPSAASQTTKELKSGYYNVSSIYRNDDNMRDNETTIFITPAFSAFSLLAHNVSITFNFYDEVTLDPYTLPKNISFYYGNTQRGNYTLGIESSITIGLPEIPSKISTSIGPTGEFFRWQRINGTQFSQVVDVYLPDYITYTLEVYTFDLTTDPLNIYNEGYFKIQLPTPSGLIVITYMSREPDGTLEVPLIKNHLYRLIVYNADLSKQTEVGDYIAGDELTMKIALGQVSFSTDMELTQKFLTWSATRTSDSVTCPGGNLLPGNCNIRVKYLDRTNTTTSLTIRIFAANSSGLQYSTTVAGTSEYTLNWPHASTNNTHQYYVEISSTTSKFGTISESLPAIQKLQGMPIVDLGISQTSCQKEFNSNPSDSCWQYDALAIMLTLFILGIFSAYAMEAGAIISSLSLGMLYAFGWVNLIPPIFIAVLILISLIYSLGNRKVSR